MDAKRGQVAAEWVGGDDTGRQAAQLSADGTLIERVMDLTVPVLDQP